MILFREVFFMSKVSAKRLFFSTYFLSSSLGRKIALLGVFIALSIVVNVFSIDVTPTQKISFTYLVGFFVGTYFGGIPGFIIMFLGDFIGILITGAIYWFPTGIATACLALIPGIVMNALPFRFQGGVFVKAAIAMALMFLLVTCGIGAWANYQYVKIVVYAGRVYETAFTAYLTTKIAFSSIVSAINYALVFLLIPVCNKIKVFPMKIE